VKLPLDYEQCPIEAVRDLTNPITRDAAGRLPSHKRDLTPQVARLLSMRRSKGTDPLRELQFATADPNVLECNGDALPSGTRWEYKVCVTYTVLDQYPPYLAITGSSTLVAQEHIHVVKNLRMHSVRPPRTR